MERSNLKFHDLVPGQRIVDEFDQKCVVESVDVPGLVCWTRRYEGRTFWDGNAKWSAQQFNARRWGLLWKGKMPVGDDIIRLRIEAGACFKDMDKRMPHRVIRLVEMIDPNKGRWQAEVLDRRGRVFKKTKVSEKSLVKRDRWTPCADPNLDLGPGGAPKKGFVDRWTKVIEQI